MSELLTSLDIVNKAFKKTMRGYDSAEVDEFLDRVAESIQAYVQKAKDLERTVEEQGEKLKDYDTIKGSLHEALIMAQRTAEEKIANAAKLADEKVGDATTRAEDIIAEAKVKAERMIKDVENDIVDMGSELDKLNELKNAGFEHLRSFLSDISSAIDGASNKGLEIPDFTRSIMKKRNETAAAEPESTGALFVLDSSSPSEDEPQPIGETKKIELSDTLNALGIDPNLLNPEIGKL